MFANELIFTDSVFIFLSECVVWPARFLYVTSTSSVFAALNVMSIIVRVLSNFIFISLGRSSPVGSISNSSSVSFAELGNISFPSSFKRSVT